MQADQPDATLPPPPRRPRDCTHDKLRRLMRRLATHYDARLRAVGLKTTQYSLLARVVHLGPVRPGDLALAMGVDASTLTRNLKPLVAAGWVLQATGPDARSRLVSATAPGREKLAEARVHWREAQLALSDQLGAERVAALHALVDESLALLPSADDTGAHDD
ncbi:MAG: MarR family winged helix-turn-helix transcriptional regulator [Pseudomonadota bacterium]